MKGQLRGGENVLKISFDGVDLTSLLLEDRTLCLRTAIDPPAKMDRVENGNGQCKMDRMEGGSEEGGQNGPLGSQAEEPKVPMMVAGLAPATHPTLSLSGSALARKVGFPPLPHPTSP